jgi:hypothetical protein
MHAKRSLVNNIMHNNHPLFNLNRDRESMIHGLIQRLSTPTYAENLQTTTHCHHKQLIIFSKSEVSFQKQPESNLLRHYTKINGFFIHELSDDDLRFNRCLERTRLMLCTQCAKCIHMNFFISKF